MCTLQGQLALVLESSRGVYSYRQSFAIVLTPCEVLDILEVAECPGKQVRAHDWRFVEADDLVAVLLTLASLLLWHVAQSGEIIRYLNLEVEGGLKIGLVETGEGSASI